MLLGELKEMDIIYVSATGGKEPDMTEYYHAVGFYTGGLPNSMNISTSDRKEGSPKTEIRCGDVAEVLGMLTHFCTDKKDFLEITEEGNMVTFEIDDKRGSYYNAAGFFLRTEEPNHMILSSRYPVKEVLHTEIPIVDIEGFGLLYPGDSLYTRSDRQRYL